MKKITLTLLALFLVFSCSEKFDFFVNNNEDKLAASDEFVQGSEDIPLLIALEKTSDEAIGFDSHSGSIISSSYKSEIPNNEIRNFYVKTLPQMGWKIIKNLENKAVFKKRKREVGN